MNFQSYVNLNSEHEFNSYCAQKNIEVFNKASDQNQYPSRGRFFILLVKEILCVPFYLVNKIGEVFLNTWALLNSTKVEPEPFASSCAQRLALITFQLFTPFVCLTIRICATTLGLLRPSVALKGWEIAESGEQLCDQLWHQNLQECVQGTQEKQIYAEIIPSNAIFYLGQEKTCLILNEKNHQKKLDPAISSKLYELIQNIASTNYKCFQIIFNYDLAIKPQQSLTRNHRYFISEDVKKILINLKPGLPQDDLLRKEQVDEWLKEYIDKGLEMEMKERLFLHIFFNLQNALLDDPLNFHEPVLTADMTLLTDLFSQRFRFGRAHFPLCSSQLSMHSLI